MRRTQAPAATLLSQKLPVGPELLCPPSPAGPVPGNEGDAVDAEGCPKATQGGTCTPGSTAKSCLSGLGPKLRAGQPATTWPAALSQSGSHPREEERDRFQEASRN